MSRMTCQSNTISRARAIALLSLGAAASAAPAQQWNLVFEDEFDGTSLSSTWQPMLGDGCQFGICGWGNNELQYYTDRPENIDVSDGTLKIIARRENFNGYAYTSARLRTINQLDVKYGRLEGRIRLPSTTGIWPAFWMLPTGSPYGGWAASGEIDIMESVNDADRVYGTTHHGGEFPNNASAGNSFVPGPDLSAGFHTYAIEWEPHQIRWYFDGTLYHQVTNATWFSSNGGTWAPFDQDFHFLLNVAVGGNFPGDPNGGSRFPQTMEVDYVRVFEAVQSPFGGAPAVIPGVIEAERYDEGGGGTAYLDADASNNGGAFRSDAVDKETVGGNVNVGWIQDQEWLEYTVDVQTAGQYTVSYRVASQSGGGDFLLENGAFQIGSQRLHQGISVGSTGGWQNWVELQEQVTLQAGEQILRFRAINGGFNFDYFTFTLDSTFCVADVTTTNTNPFNTGYGEPDGVVDGADLGYFIERWLTNNLEADITTSNTNPGDPGFAEPDGSVDGADLSYFVEVWLSGCA